MNRSLAISASAHLLMLLLLLFGGPLFRSDEAQAIQITEVDIVSASAFDAARSTAPEAPRAEVPELTPPDPEAALPETPAETSPPERTEAVRPGMDAAETPPDLAGMRSNDAPVVTLEAPPSPQTLAQTATPDGSSLTAPEIVGPRVPEQARRRPDATSLAPPAPPAPAPRISSTPAPKPPVEAREAEEAAPEIAPSPDATEVAEERPPEAPPEAATEIVPEAERAPERPESVAPLASAPPPKRPDRRVAEEPPATEAPATEAPSQTAAADPARDPAPARPAAPATNRPVGPPVTAREKDGITLPIRKYWNFGTLRGVEGWEGLVVEVRFQVAPDGSIVGDVTPHNPANPQGNHRRAFDLARRAILNAARNGEIRFPPQEKYERWKDIIITFDPKSQNVGF